MSTRRQREMLLSSDQALYIGKTLDASVRRVVKTYLSKSTVTYAGRGHDQKIVDQVLQGIIYDLHRDLENTITRITKRFIP